MTIHAKRKPSDWRRAPGISAAGGEPRGLEEPWRFGWQLNFFSEGGGILGCPTPPPGGRVGSENDTLLPMTMTCDRLKFWSGPASVKIYHPETLAAEE